MPFQSIEPRRLYRQIADQIRTLVKSGEYPPGSRLPPERDLAKQLGVSRPSVREALIALEVEGYVEVRVGSPPARGTRQSETLRPRASFRSAPRSPIPTKYTLPSGAAVGRLTVVLVRVI